MSADCSRACRTGPDGSVQRGLVRGDSGGDVITWGPRAVPVPLLDGGGRGQRSPARGRAARYGEGAPGTGRGRSEADVMEQPPVCCSVSQ